MRETTLQTPRSVEKEGGGGARDVGAESLPLQLVMKGHDEAGCPPAAHGGPWWSRYLTIAHGRGPMPEQEMPEGSCDPVGSPLLEQAPARTCGPVERGAHTGAGLLAGLVTP